MTPMLGKTLSSTNRLAVRFWRGTAQPPSSTDVHGLLGLGAQASIPGRGAATTALLSCVEHEDERRAAAGYVLYRGRTGNADSISPKHDAGVQRNLLGHLHMNPPAGYINAPSRHASNLTAFVEPCQPDWFV
jgi:hypothetical protein